MSVMIMHTDSAAKPTTPMRSNPNRLSQATSAASQSQDMTRPHRQAAQNVASQPLRPTQFTMPAKSDGEDYVVTLRTDSGDIRLRLYDEAPLHRDNMVYLAATSAFDGMLFHRVIKDFIIQSGDPASINAAEDARLGMSNYGKNITRENTFPKRYHKYGALAAARTGDANNAMRSNSGSQFYIVTSKNRPDSAKIVDLMRRHREEYRSRLKNVPSFRMQIFGSERELSGREIDSIMNVIYPLNIDDPAVLTSDPFQQMLRTYESTGGAYFLDEDYTVYGEVLDEKSMRVVEAIQLMETNGDDRPRIDIHILGSEVSRIPKQDASLNQLSTKQ